MMKHKLTSPTISVQSETFLPLLSTTNQHGLPDAHPNDMESPAYMTKFRACLTRALEMVRSHMQRVLETATSAASQQDLRLKENLEVAKNKEKFTHFEDIFPVQCPGFLLMMNKSCPLSTAPP